jgi:hypothetical protein
MRATLRAAVSGPRTAGRRAATIHAERTVALDAQHHLQVMAEQEPGNVTLVHLRILAQDGRHPGQSLALPPNRLPDVIRVLTGIADALGVRP